MPTDVTRHREHLLSALGADLIGPYELPDGGADTSDELLRLPPSRWYLTGFLAPMEAREVSEPTVDEMAAGPDHDDEDGASADAGPKRRHFLPASLGLSVLLQPATEAGEAETVRATVSWADYVAEDCHVEDYDVEDCDVEDLEVEDPESGEAKTKRFWRRKPRAPVSVDLTLDHQALARGTELEGAYGVWLTGRLAEGSARGLAPGTRALSLFVVNRRGPGEKGKADASSRYGSRSRTRPASRRGPTGAARRRTPRRAGRGPSVPPPVGVGRGSRRIGRGDGPRRRRSCARGCHDVDPAGRGAPGEAGGGRGSDDQDGGAGAARQLRGRAP